MVEVPPEAASKPRYGGSVTNDDIKAKMREALEKKQEVQHGTAEGAEGSEKVHGPEVHGPGKRVHRRKSG
jgi:hypothetical protein